MNATKHGLSSTSLSLLKQGSEELRERLARWLEFYEPRAPEERLLIERAVLASAQKQRCIAAAHRHLRSSGNDGATVPTAGDETAIAPEPRREAYKDNCMTIYRRYEQMHDKVFLHAYGKLLELRTEAAAAVERGSVTAAGPVGDDDRRSQPYGYY